MKDFTRLETRFSLCGLNCALCSMRQGGYCPGCGGGAGNQSCAIARCSIQQGGISFCWECPEYPCPRYDGFDDGDSFVPHRSRQQDIVQVLEMGLDAYLTQLEEKHAILEVLLSSYNDGRRKTLFHTAVYLLPLEDLRMILAGSAACRKWLRVPFRIEPALRRNDFRMRQTAGESALRKGRREANEIYHAPTAAALFDDSLWRKDH